MLGETAPPVVEPSHAMAQPTAPSASALGAGGAVGSSNEDLHAELDELFRLRASVDGRIVERLGEAAGRESFRDEGATSAETWVVERFGVSAPTARAYVHMAERTPDLVNLAGALCEGDISFDKVRAVADVATRENDRELCDQARGHSVRELVDITRTTAARLRNQPPAGSAPDRRYLRFNDKFRTMTAQLPAAAYAEAKASLEARAREIPSDDTDAAQVEASAQGARPSDGGGRKRWDQRLHDAFMELIRSSVSGSSNRPTKASPFFVVAHVPLSALVEDSGEPTDLAGELESDGLIDAETVERIVCGGTIAIAVDDDVGHTMYEGRARRFATPTQRREVMRRDRRCRFPGCENVTFADVHHIVPWKSGGRTDLPNLALLCEFHHGVVHRKVWSMSGNANEELTIVGPTGRVMVSRPSPVWTRVAGRGSESGSGSGSDGAGGPGGARARAREPGP
jgi:Domain of unknown function (DUF222)/HNH endonuclease